MIQLRDVSFRLGATEILDNASFTLHAGERIALIGRNGTGKSTLMKLLNKTFIPQSGQIEFNKELKVAYLPQDVPDDLKGSVSDIILEGLGDKVVNLVAYHKQAKVVAERPEPKELERLQKLQEKLDASGGWQWESETEKWASLLQLDPHIEASELSGGLKRRVLLGKALIAQPDLLMLDEPTNHLDIPSIEWMEQFLLSQKVSLLFVTHDKSFLNKIATGILELDRARLLRFEAPYVKYLEQKEQQLEAEEAERKRMDKKWAEEEVWVRKSLQARRTRNMGRVRALETMREERKQRKHRSGQINLNVQDSERSGAKVFELKNISFSWDQKPIIQGLSTLISRGDKVGIVGPNGCGKSTLIQLILGDLKPEMGTVVEGTRILLGYFDQLREQLDPEKTPKEVVFDGYEYADIAGQRKHVIGYLSQFLFTKDRANTPIKVLSGGEKNRLVLARILSKPSNVLVLDEPTNDLDMESLELLEDLLVDYPGSVLLVSHDRDFMANVCTQLLVFKGQGKVIEYSGSFEDWTAILKQEDDRVEDNTNSTKENKDRLDSASQKQETKAKLTYKERKELSALPDKIEKLELDLASIQEELAQPELYKSDNTALIKEKNDQIEQLQHQIDVAMHRWEELLERD